MIFLDRFIKWLDKPYNDEMDAMGWFLFMGLIALITLAWGSIIRKVGS